MALTPEEEEELRQIQAKLGEEVEEEPSGGLILEDEDELQQIEAELARREESLQTPEPEVDTQSEQAPEAPEQQVPVQQVPEQVAQEDPEDMALGEESFKAIASSGDNVVNSLTKFGIRMQSKFEGAIIDGLEKLASYREPEAQARIQKRLDGMRENGLFLNEVANNVERTETGLQWEAEVQEQLNARSGGSINPFDEDTGAIDALSNIQTEVIKQIPLMATFAINPAVGTGTVVSLMDGDYIDKATQLGLTAEEIEDHRLEAVAASSSLGALSEAIKLNKIPVVGKAFSKLASTVLGKAVGVVGGAGIEGISEYSETAIQDYYLGKTLAKRGLTEEQIREMIPETEMFKSKDFWLGALTGGGMKAVQAITSGDAKSEAGESVQPIPPTPTEVKIMEAANSNPEAELQQVLQEADAITQDAALTKLDNFTDEEVRSIIPDMELAVDENGKLTEEALKTITIADEVLTEKVLREDAMDQIQSQIKEVSKKINDTGDVETRAELRKTKRKLEQEATAFEEAAVEKEGNLTDDPKAQDGTNEVDNETDTTEVVDDVASPQPSDTTGETQEQIDDFVEGNDTVKKEESITEGSVLTKSKINKMSQAELEAEPGTTGNTKSEMREALINQVEEQQAIDEEVDVFEETQKARAKRDGQGFRKDLKTQKQIDAELGVKKPKVTDTQTEKQFYAQKNKDIKAGKKIGVREFKQSDRQVAQTKLEKKQKGQINSLKTSRDTLSKKVISKDQKLAAIDEASTSYNDILKDIDSDIKKAINMPKLKITSRMKPETIEAKFKEVEGKIAYAVNKQRKRNSVNRFNEISKKFQDLSDRPQKGLFVDAKTSKDIRAGIQLIAQGERSQLSRKLRKEIDNIANGKIDVGNLTAKEIDQLSSEIEIATKTTGDNIRFKRRIQKGQAEAQAAIFGQQIGAFDTKKSSRQVAASSKGVKGFLKGLKRNALQARRVATRLTGSDNNVLTEKIDNMYQGKADSIGYKNNFIQKTAEIDNDYDWDKASTEVVAEVAGNELTKSNIMSIYAYSKSELGMQRLAYTDGILNATEQKTLSEHTDKVNDLNEQIADIEYDQTNGHKKDQADLTVDEQVELAKLKDSKAELNQQKKTAVVLAESKAQKSVRDITNKLTAKEKSIVDQSIAMAEGDLYDAANETYQTINGGQSMPKRNSYFKLKNVQRVQESAAETMGSIEGLQSFGKRGVGLDQSFTKSTAKGPIGFNNLWENDFNQTRSEMIGDVSTYAGRAKSVIDYKTLIDNSKGYMNKVDTGLHKYFSDYLKDDISPTPKKIGSKILDSLMGIQTIRALGANLKVTAYQAASYPLVYKYASSKNMAKGILRGITDLSKATVDTKNVKKLSDTIDPTRIDFVKKAITKDPMMLERMNNIEQTMMDAQKAFTGKPSKAGRAYQSMQELMMAGIHKVDAVTSAAVWNAAYDTATDQGKSETESIQWARRAVTETQPMSDSLSRTGFQRSGSIMRALAPFSSQRAQLYGMYGDVFNPKSGLTKTERLKQITALGVSQSMVSFLQAGMPTAAVFAITSAFKDLLGEEDLSEDKKKTIIDTIVTGVEQFGSSTITQLPAGEVLQSGVKGLGDKVRRSQKIDEKHDWGSDKYKAGLLGSIFITLNTGMENMAKVGDGKITDREVESIYDMLNSVTVGIPDAFKKVYKNWGDFQKSGNLKYLIYGKFMVKKLEKASKKKSKLSYEDIMKAHQAFKESM